MKITKKQIKELHQSGDVSKLREWYPSVFGEELEKDYTGWVKTKSKSNKEWIMYFENGMQQYGIDSTGEWWIKNSIIRMEGDEIKATHQEIETALINEAKKRGLWDNPNIICLFCNEKNTTEGLAVCFSNNMLWGKHGKIFDNGTWATIIEPKQMTQEQIEKELGYKIDIV